MEIANLGRYLERIHGVVSYAVDVGGSSVTEADFFQKLYVERAPDKEAQINRFLESVEPGVLVIEGLRGCGKTSFLRAALKKASGAQSLQVLFDCDREKLLLEAAEGLSEVEAYKYYHTELRRRSIDDMSRGGLQAVAKFIIAAREVRPLQELRLRASLEDPKRRLRSTDEIEAALVQRPALCLQQVLALLGELSLADIARAWLRIAGKSRFLLVVDNLDRVAAAHQPVLFRVLMDTYFGGAGQIAVVVTARSRNTRSVQLSGAGKAGSRAIVLDDQREDDRGFTEKVFSCRHAYISENILAPSNDAAELDRIYEQLEARVNDEFVHEGLTRLANGSYKDVLDLKQQFLEYLISLVVRDTVLWDRESNALQLSEFDCRSYLFRWMYSLMNDEHEWLLDPIRRYEDYDRQKSADAVACDLSIVVLSWLYNHREHRTRLRDLVRDFDTIGVQEEEAQRAIYELYDTANPRWRHVELGEGETRVAEERLKNEPGLVVEATPLGSEFVHSTMLKFEFLVAALQYPLHRLAGAGGADDRVVDDVAPLLPRLTQYFQIMSKAHVDALTKYKAACADPSWESYYRSRFCIGGMLIVERTMRSHLRHVRRRYGAQFDVVQKEYANLLEAFYAGADIHQDVTKVLTVPASRSVAGGMPGSGREDDGADWEPEMQP